MEDAESVVDDVLALHPTLAEAVGVSSASFYGVYDGHAGARAAAYLAANLLDVVVACLVESRARTDEAREAALARAFRVCDQRLMETSVAESWEDGSTAVVCLQLDDRLYFANAGDAESVTLWPVPPQLSANALAVALTLSLKFTTMLVVNVTLVVPLIGLVLVTVGAASVVNAKT